MENTRKRFNTGQNTPENPGKSNKTGSGVVADFAACDTDRPNCVVVGDAEEDFTYANMNQAFRVLMASERPLLVSLGCG